MPTKKPSQLVIGILGGGQLGRMTAQAAEKLGYACHIYESQKNSCAEKLGVTTTVSHFLDEDALTAFAKTVDVITLEFENIPVETLKILEKNVPVHPSSDILSVCQDRILEKEFCRGLKINTAPFAAVDDEKSLQQAIDTIGLPAVLKTRRMGYDGKGQVLIKTQKDAAVALQELGGKNLILEGFVAFDKEVSVIAARDQQGNITTYPVVENIHKHHILSETIAPADVTKETAQKAKDIATRIAEKFNLIGLLAVEMFVTKDGDVLVNEMAPRPHNSGHWTMDGAKTSQFEQLVRIVAGLSLGSTEVVTPTHMYNLLGQDIHDLDKWRKNPQARIHDYDKGEARVGRKMGHVNVLEK